MKHNSRNPRKKKSPVSTTNKKIYVNYTITDEPIRNQENDLPASVTEQLETLFLTIAHTPKQAIEPLLVLKATYPNASKIYNFLSVAYGRVGNHRAMQAVILENYQHNPDYLFAKINYAQLCLTLGELDKIPLIFNNQFDLKLLYPKRNVFHITEFAGLTGVICAYYCSIGERDAALLLFDALKEVTPESDMVNYAKSFLFPSLLTRFLRKGRKILSQYKNQKTQDQDVKFKTWTFYSMFKFLILYFREPH